MDPPSRLHPRRQFLRASLILVGLSLLVGCAVPGPWALSRPRPARIAWLASGNPTSMSGIFTALRQGLADLGYQEGRNLVLEARWAEDQPSRLPELAQDVVQLQPDVIVAQGPQPSRALKALTTTIPIVAVSVSDPVGLGLVASLAHPGGNLTGFTLVPPSLPTKRLQLLKEAAPSIARVAFVYDPQNPTDRQALATAQQAASTLQVTLVPVEVSDPRHLGPSLAQAAAPGVDGVVFYAGPLISCCIPQLVTFTIDRRLPAMFPYHMAVNGQAVGNVGLMSYAADPFDNYRRAASYVDRILRGTSPADLPIEQPSKFDFVINTATARAIGLTIPASVLAQATEVIP